MDSLAARVGYPKTPMPDKVAVRRRAAREMARRQIDTEDWIAAAKAREKTSTPNA